MYAQNHLCSQEAGKNWENMANEHDIDSNKEDGYVPVISNACYCTHQYHVMNRYCTCILLLMIIKFKLDRDDWGDWNDFDVQETFCLFCHESAGDANDVIHHMRSAHSFVLGPPLDFYQNVKAVNFLRRQRQLLRCGYCDQQFDNGDLLMVHLENEEHCKLPEDAHQWDQPQYVLPDLGLFHADSFTIHIC